MVTKPLSKHSIANRLGNVKMDLDYSSVFLRTKLDPKSKFNNKCI